MLVQRDDLHEAYRDLRSRASASRPVLVQVGPDADAVCACATITALLRIDQVPYRVTPAHSYEDLGRGLHGVGALVLINCGATVDLEQHLDGAGSPERRVYVLDSHRPYHLANVRPDNDQIVCLDPAPEPIAYPDHHDLSSDDNDDDAERRQRIQRRMRVAEHYGGTYFDQAAAVLAYDLAQQLHKDDRDMLWSAIIGLTDQYLFDRIPRWSYQAQAHLLRGHLFHQARGDDGGDVAVVVPGDAESQVRVPAAGTITFEPHDLQFTLVRHWTLYDAMSHSRRLATRLKLWRDTGTQQLNLLLAKLGIPRQESCSPYVLMRADCKKRLHDDLAKYAGEYGLEPHDLFLPAFTRRYEDGLVVSGADLVLIMTAVLDSSSSESGFWSAVDTLRAAQTPLLRKSLPMAVDLQEKVFHRAHALLSKRAITSTGKYRLCIMDSGEVQQVFARPLALTQLGLFLIDAYEQVLGEQSAAHRSSKRPRRRLKILPFVLCAEVEQRHSYLVVGIVRSADQHAQAEIQRNTFSVAFTDAAILTKARARQDGFEASVVEIAKDDLRPFLESLVHQM